MATVVVAIAIAIPFPAAAVAPCVSEDHYFLAWGLEGI